MYRAMTLSVLVVVTGACPTLSVPCELSRDCHSDEFCHQGACCTPCNGTADCSGDEVCRDGICELASDVGDVHADDVHGDATQVDDANNDRVDGGNRTDGQAWDVSATRDAGVRFDSSTSDVAAMPPAIKVVLLAGQSNMVGFGLRSELPSELQAPVAGVYIHDEGNVDATVAGTWLPLAPGFGASPWCDSTAWSIDLRFFWDE